MSTLPPCSHTNTTRWFPNTGNLFDDTANGHAMLIKHPIGNVAYLTLCKDCGVTFVAGSTRDNRRRTAATLRELEALVNE